MKSHTVASFDMEPDPDRVMVSDGVFLHVWSRAVLPDEDIYFEDGPGGLSSISDDPTPGDIDLVFIEVQYGETLDENDIVRLDDVYGRKSA